MAALLAFGAVSAGAAERSFKIYAVEINGAKFWLPSTIVVKKGDQVRLEAQTKLEGQAAIHGLSIPDYGIKEQVDNQLKPIEFTASKAGIFPITCHMHPPHVGSQLIVLE